MSVLPLARVLVLPSVWVWVLRLRPGSKSVSLPRLARVTALALPLVSARVLRLPPGLAKALGLSLGLLSVPLLVRARLKAG